MKRRDFLKVFASMSFLGLSPALPLISPIENKKQPDAASVENTYTREQLDALQKIKYYEDQLQRQNGRFSWHLHNNLRHYWGAFSEKKSLSHANIILENMIMDVYTLNILSNWHFAPEYQPVQPRLAIESLQHRAEIYSDLHYVSAACWLRAGEITSAIGDTTLARDHYQRAINVSREFKSQAAQLSVYERIAQLKLEDKL